MLDIFDADRAWLLTPCDPDTETWRVPFEVTTADYPGAFATGHEIPNDAAAAELFTATLTNENPLIVTFDPRADGAPEWVRRFRIRSQMCMALHLSNDRPWLIGLHYCRDSRNWTAAEQHLFRAIGQRMTEILDRMLLTRHLQRDVERRKQVEETLRHRVAMEQLVAGIAGRLVGVSAETMNEEIETILGMLGEFAGVDRSYLFQIGADGRSMRKSHEWCAGVIAPQIDELQELPAREFAWAIDRLRSGKTLNIPAVTALPDSEEALRRILNEGGIRSLVNVPLHAAGRLIGCLGFDAVRTEKQWAEEDVVLLETVAALLSGALVRRDSEMALRRSEAGLATAQQVARLGSWELDLEKDELCWSDQVYRIFEIDPGRFDATYEAFINTVHPDDRAIVDQAFGAALGSGAPYDIVHRLLLPDGRIKYVHEMCEFEFDAANRPRRAIGVVHDVTKQYQADLLSARLGRILEHSWNEICTFDAETLRLVEVSDGACRNLGYTQDELRRLTMLDLLPEFTQRQFETLAKPLRHGEERQVTLEARQRRKDGSRYPVEVRLQLSSTERPPVFIAISQDISERKRYIAELEHKSLYDVLTELPNRTLLQDRLQQALKAMRRMAQPLAVLVIDVMRLKEVNDILGHRNGDRVLQEVAQRLQTTIRESDTLARLGGDEFAIVLPTMDVEHAVIAANKIGEVFEAPIDIDETPLGMDIALGIAIYPDHGDAPNVLLQHADIAMRVAKNENTGFVIYDPEDDPFSQRRLRLHGELRQAIGDNALMLHYQPKIDIASGRVTSVEALARWPHPRETMIAPKEFMPMVEQSGLIRPFTLWVLERAIDQCRDWNRRGIGLSIAVNISTRNLLDPALTDSIARLLDKYAVPPACIILEITESAVMSWAENALKVLGRLHGMGLRIAIDDFGTGYSSLAYLKRMPVDELKIDASLVSDIVASENDAVIVRSTIDLAHNLGLKVVAEGVESKEVLVLLGIMNCDIAQGYFFSHPLSADGLERWMAESPWAANTP